MQKIKRPLALIILAFLAFSLMSCNLAAETITPVTLPRTDETVKVEKPENGKSGVVYLSATADKTDAETVKITDEYSAAVTDFAMKLLGGANEEDKNALFSPLSVIIALAMTLNGADNNTKAEMEETLGLPCDKLNSYIYSYLKSLNNTDKAALVAANSVWVASGNGFSADGNFINNVVNYYSADVVAADFNSAETLGEINGWVKENTDGMIEKILERLNPDTVMILMNALTFDAEWMEKFNGEAVLRDFTNADGAIVKVPMMYKNEHLYCFDGDNETGFIKPYADGYSYVAFLPDEGISVEDYIKSLDGAQFGKLIGDAKRSEVHYCMPKYSLDYSLELNKVLMSLGMKDAFDCETADFGKIGKTDDGSNVFISEVIHKTHIDVDESGTRAAAVTAVIMEKSSAIKNPTPYVEIYLNRPFVYAIIDNESQLPIFIGTVKTLG